MSLNAVSIYFRRTRPPIWEVRFLPCRRPDDIARGRPSLTNLGSDTEQHKTYLNGRLLQYGPLWREDDGYGRSLVRQCLESNLAIVQFYERVHEA